MSTRATIASLLNQLAERRTSRHLSRRLEEDLSNYSTPAQRRELDAILSRHSQEEVEQLETLLRHPLSRTINPYAIPAQRIRMN